MRIGTWNLDGRWSPRHRRLLAEAECDVWLLTEVPESLSLSGGHLVRSDAMPGMRAKSWAAIWSNQPVTAPAAVHPAAALAECGDLLLCSCVLPWRGARPYWPDEGSTVAAMTLAALRCLEPSLTSTDFHVVWGGDWNHAMTGREHAGSMEGRCAIGAVVAAAGLVVTTDDAPHRIAGLLSIDHIAVPTSWASAPCRRVVAEAQGRRLSDHDAYVVEVEGP